jgi:hypothetical protein
MPSTFAEFGAVDCRLGFSYDAVWLAALSFVALNSSLTNATRSCEPSAADEQRGHMFYQSLLSTRFQGASAGVRLAPNGDRAPSSIKVSIENILSRDSTRYIGELQDQGEGIAVPGGNSHSAIDFSAIQWADGTNSIPPSFTRVGGTADDEMRLLKMVGSAIVLAALTFAGFCWYQRNREKEERMVLTMRSFKEIQSNWHEDGFFSDGQARNWEIELNEIEFGSVLGKGAGGTVYAAKYNSIDVAVKQLKVSVFDEDHETFLEAKNEYQVLGQYFHPNIIR